MLCDLADNNVADDDIQLLLQTYAICKKNNIQLPLEAIGAEIKTKKGLPIGGNAISQHLTKVCKRRIAANLPVPVSIEGRGSPGKKSKPPPKIANRSSQDDDDEEKEEVSIDIGAGSDESFSEAPFTRGKRTLRSKKQKITEAMTDDEDANHVIDDSNMGDVDTEDTAENFDPNAEYIGAGAGFLTYTKDESMEPVVEYKGSEKKATEQGEVSPKQSRIVTLRFSKGRLFSANPEKLAGSPSFVKLTNVASFESPPAIFSSQPASLSPLDQTASLDSYQQAESFPAYSHNFDDSGSAGSFTQPSVYGSGLTHQNQGPLNLYLMDGSYVHNPNHIAMQGFQNGLSPINHDLDDFFDFQDASNITTNSTNLSGSYGQLNNAVWDHSVTD